jgi:CHASE3 domain sensor protein
MTIKYKIICGFLALVLLIGVVGYYGFYSSSIILKEYVETSRDFQEEVIAAIEAQSYAKRSEGHLFLYLMFGDAADREKFFTRHRSLVERQETNDDAQTLGWSDW